jgi:hypothetical protein
LLSELEALLKHQPPTVPTNPDIVAETEMEEEKDGFRLEDDVLIIDYTHASHLNTVSAVPAGLPPRSTEPSASSNHLFMSWKRVISTIIQPYVEYLTKTLGKPISTTNEPLSGCSELVCEHKRTSIVCLYFDCALLSLCDA